MSSHYFCLSSAKENNELLDVPSRRLRQPHIPKAFGIGPPLLTTSSTVALTRSSRKLLECELGSVAPFITQNWYWSFCLNLRGWSSKMLKNLSFWHEITLIYISFASQAYCHNTTKTHQLIKTVPRFIYISVNVKHLFFLKHLTKIIRNIFLGASRSTKRWWYVRIGQRSGRFRWVSLARR